jgi:hypothetical protein
MKRFSIRHLAVILAGGLLGLAGFAAGPARANDTFSFPLIVSAGAESCLPEANGTVTLNSLGIVEEMHIQVNFLPANTDFDVFVIQQPNAPFGLAWYEGDILTDSSGSGVTDLIGRFQFGTFIVAPGSTAAPVTQTKGPFPDASSNLGKEGPVQLYHVGIWFDSPQEALKLGCTPTLVTTPFNSEHQGGIQVLNSGIAKFTKIGPLGHFNP